MNTPRATALPALRAAAATAAITLLLLLAACAGPQPRASRPATTTGITVAAALESAGEAVPEAALLNLSITVFDPGLEQPAPSPVAVYPELRRSEARFLAYLLRDTLTRSGQWGAVRVLPETDPTADLDVAATIRRSDGQALSLDVRAVDAANRVWLDDSYYAVASSNSYTAGGENDPFQPLFNRLANDLLAVRRGFSETELTRLSNVAMLRYAGALAPSLWDAYLEADDAGVLRPVRLPARDDPALARILRIREAEYLFADTLDAHYGDLFAAMRRDYTLWRAYSLEEIDALARYRATTARQRRDDGSVHGMMRRYGDFRELKLQEAALREAATTLEGIVAPSVLSLEGTVLRLEGSLADRYGQWRRLLREIQATEVGLPPPE